QEIGRKTPVLFSLFTVHAVFRKWGIGNREQGIGRKLPVFFPYSLFTQYSANGDSGTGTGNRSKTFYSLFPIPYSLFTQ
ncbi:hypothetical protein, partial [Negadavirga shengliensis]